MPILDSQPISSKTIIESHLKNSVSQRKLLSDYDPKELAEYRPKNKIKFITATALFDGHDASINIMRRLLQSRGVEVVHLGHNRSALDIARAAIHEDVQGVAISSYQGGHMEFFKYVRELLDSFNGRKIKIFGGGGGVIVPREVQELERNGITKIYTPEDGQRYGLDGMIGHMLVESDFTYEELWADETHLQEGKESELFLSRALTLLESGKKDQNFLIDQLTHKGILKKRFQKVPVIGITGTGGAGKSSLTDELISRFLWDMPDVKVAVVCIDPTKKKGGGALLGDRIRLNSAVDSRVFVRSFATRGSGKEVAGVTEQAVGLLKHHDFDFIIVETSGIGQGDSTIVDLADISLYVMTSEFGAKTQLEKIDMLDFAHLIAINKYERRGSQDALKDVQNQLRRTRFAGQVQDSYPVYGTIASRFNDDGTNGLYRAIVDLLNRQVQDRFYKVHESREYSHESSNRQALIPVERASYLSEIAQAVRNYHKNVDDQVQKVALAESYEKVLDDLKVLSAEVPAKDPMIPFLSTKRESLLNQVDPDLRYQLDHWEHKKNSYLGQEYVYQVRGQETRVKASFVSLAQKSYPKVTPPHYGTKSEVARYLLKENFPGFFPYTAGVFPFRREGEDPQRQFAGEGGPQRTNTRFHYLSKNSSAKRLSTAFDSVTLYGAEPHKRPDIYGKVGESGVSIATLDDMKLLYKGFDLCSPSTSVSMTINGPAPIILAMFLNTAIDQQIDLFLEENKRAPTPQEHEKIYDKTLMAVRGTVQADILKEDQAQNTCIFSTEFALKMMADIQEYFINHKVRNYYSVSISGYHIAEAGANPITQLAFTLANGFTYTEYYRSRGMNVNDFAPNLSFFFSNGLDPEYAVMGRVARRIWAIAMRDIYGGDERSQKLKYHIQTSGRSLHAQEIDFNDIRTTLQALLALYDNCNSLHTNAFDEAITTPTEDSVRRAMAIQLIINKEFGPNGSQNINQGSYFLEYLTDIVEEAVLEEFERISSRGGVLGAMETQYQRSKIQEESLYYEHLKHTGQIPIMGVNTFLNPKAVSGEYQRPEIELIRASYEEKNDQLDRLEKFKATHHHQREKARQNLAQAVFEGRNIFAELMHTVRSASLGEITETLYQVGGQYRRSV
jgi:methylmalonyl-CoA mutase